MRIRRGPYALEWRQTAVSRRRLLHAAVGAIGLLALGGGVCGCAGAPTRRVLPMASPSQSPAAQGGPARAPAAAREAEGNGRYANNDGVRIYYEVSGSGSDPPLLLYHGFGGSSAVWSNYGFTSAFSPHCRVICIDARGHGRSDKPHSAAAYSMEKRTGDVCAVLDAERIDRVNFMGYSNGGRSGFGMAQFHQDRLRTLIIGGASPRSPSQYDQEEMTAAAKILREQGVWAYLGAAYRSSPNADSIRAALERNDAEALACDREGLLTWDGMDSATVEVPTFLYVGGADGVLPQVQDAAARLANVELHVLPGLGHAAADGASAVPPLVLAFLQRQGIVRA